MHRSTNIALNLGVMSVMLFILLLPIISGPASAQGADVDFGIGIEDEPVVGNNGIFTMITLEVPIIVHVDGKYQIYANVRPLGIDWDGTSVLTEYKAGSYQVAIDIPGAKIFESKVDGPYNIELSILDKDGTPQATTTYTTSFTHDGGGTYSHKDFNTTKLNQDIPDIEIQGGWIILRFDNLTAEINTRSPIVNYYYSSDEEDEGGNGGVYSKAALKITRIIAFNDENNDGIPQNTEIDYRGNLVNLLWDFTIRFDKIYEIRLNADVILKDMNTRAGPRLDVTFIYLADETKLNNQAVTMEIQRSPDTILESTHICVETSLSDGSEEGNREFNFDNQQEYKGTFLSPKDEEENYISWQKKCSIEEETGPRTQDCTFQYQKGPGEHLMYATVPVSTYTTGITMRYNFGVLGDLEREDYDYEHKLWVWFLGIGLAIVIVIASFILQRKMSKREVV